MCKEKGCWRLHYLYYERTAQIIEKLSQENLQFLLEEFQICFKESQKPLLSAVISCIIKMLDSPIVGLRNSVIEVIFQKLAMNRSST
jgi:hypothetical protein